MRSTAPDEERKGQREDRMILLIVGFLMTAFTWSSYDGASDPSDIAACDLDQRGVIYMARTTCTKNGWRVITHIECHLPDGIVREVAARTCEENYGTPATTGTSR